VSQTALAWLGREEKAVETRSAGHAERPMQAEEAYEYLRQIDQSLYITDISDIPHLPDREKRFEAILSTPMVRTRSWLPSRPTCPML